MKVKLFSGDIINVEKAFNTWMELNDKRTIEKIKYSTVYSQYASVKHQIAIFYYENLVDEDNDSIKL